MWRFAQPYISGENKWFSKRGYDFFRKITPLKQFCSDPGSALFRSGKTICPDILHKYLFFSDSFPSCLIVLNTWTRLSELVTILVAHPWVFKGSVAEFKEFERRFKFKPRFKYGWFHLKLYQMFQDLSRRFF